MSLSPQPRGPQVKVGKVMRSDDHRSQTNFYFGKNVLDNLVDTRFSATFHAYFEEKSAWQICGGLNQDLDSCRHRWCSLGPHPMNLSNGAKTGMM